MNRTLWTLSAVAAAAALAFAVVWLSDTRTPADTDADTLEDRKPWEYSWPQAASFHSLPERFDLSSHLTLDGAQDSAARFVVNARSDGSAPAAGVYVDVMRDLLVAGRVEGGIAVRRGTARVELTPGRLHEIALRRRAADLAVTVDGRLRMLVRDGLFAGGDAAVGIRGGAQVQLEPLRALPELPEFSDDFMRSSEDPGPWTVHSGTWKTESLHTPSMSANAFRYHGTPSGVAGTPAFATAGNASWDTYRLDLSVRGGPRGGVGLAVGVDPNRHVLFRWQARLPDNEGYGELVAVRAGADGAREERVIASRPGGYVDEQWYRLSATVRFGRITVSVDDHVLVAAESDEITSGGIGLWCDGPQGATFDDVFVASLRTVDDSVDPTWPARWDTVGGSWRHEGAALIGETSQPDGEAKLISGSGEWLSHTTEASVRSWGPTRAGLVVGYRDETEYALLVADFGARKLLLERVSAGERRVLDEAPLPPGDALTLRATSDGGHLVGAAGAGRPVEAWDPTLDRGRIGVFVGGRGRATFEAFRSEILPHKRQILTDNQVFETDNIMSDWADETSDWYQSDDSTPAQSIYWHTAPFHGDVEFALDLAKTDSPKGSLVLGVSKVPAKPNNGYGWGMEPAIPADGAAPDAWRFALTREGVTMRELTLDSGQRVDSLFVRRRGGLVCGGANGKVLAEFVDHEPLSGGRVAFLARGITVQPSRTRLYGGRVFDYVFNSAPVEWRVASGKWDVTNRWICDPRWSFFSGVVDEPSGNKAVIIWNKRSFPNDVVIDFYVGPKMEPDKGKRYEYARDFNMTIAADGRDLTTGYSFVFGGFANTRSGIYRGSKPLAETQEVAARIPASMIIHQRWYHVRVRRAGNELSYRVNFSGRNIVSLTCTDDQPLTGDRIAIWSHDCNIMVARMRIAAGTDVEPALVFEDDLRNSSTRGRTMYDDTEAAQ
jgi:hypothetical protein